VNTLVARPAGLEPATSGLEEQWPYSEVVLHAGRIAIMTIAVSARGRGNPLLMPRPRREVGQSTGLLKGQRRKVPGGSPRVSCVRLVCTSDRKLRTGEEFTCNLKSR
jgi:hypothetical protein